jgi:hypothetical protein
MRVAERIGLMMATKNAYKILDGKHMERGHLRASGMYERTA